MTCVIAFVDTRFFYFLKVVRTALRLFTKDHRAVATCLLLAECASEIRSHLHLYIWFGIVLLKYLSHKTYFTPRH